MKEVSEIYNETTKYIRIMADKRLLNLFVLLLIPFLCIYVN